MAKTSPRVEPTSAALPDEQVLDTTLPTGVDALLAAIALTGPSGIARDVLEDLCDQLGIARGTIAELSESTDVVEGDGRIRIDDATHRANRSASLDGAAKIELHGLLADAIAMASLDPVSVSREAAAHRHAAGDTARAVLLLCEAADVHEAAGDFVHAVECLGDAVALAPGESPDLLLLERRARIATNAGLASAAECWASLSASAGLVGDTVSLGRASYHLYWAAADGSGAACLDAAAGLGDAAGGWADRAKALRCILGSRYDEAREHDRAALRAARERGDRQLESLSLLGTAVTLALTGDLQEAQAVQRRGISIAAAHRDHRAAITGRLNLTCMHVDDLDLTAARSEAQSLLAYVDEHGLRHWRSEILALLASIHSQLGAFAAARAALDDAAESLGEDPDAISGAYLDNLRARVLIDMGIGDVRTPLERASAVAESHNLGAIRVEIAVNRLRALAVAGRLDDLVALATTLELPDGDVSARSWAAACLARVGTLHDHAALLREAHRIRGAGDVSSSGRQVENYASELDVLLAPGSQPVAADLAAIAEEWDAVGCRLDAADVTVVVGALHERAGRHVEAAEAWQRASRAYVEMGALAALESVSARLAGLADDDDDAPLHLDESQLLDGVGEADRRELGAVAITRRFEQGRLFFSPDDENGTVYVLRSGRVRLYCMTEDGKRLTVALLDPGAVFGENAVLGRSTAGVHAEADEPVVADVIPATRMRELIQRVPRIGLNLLSLVGERLQDSHELTERVAFWTVDRRIARLILELDGRYGHPTLDGCRIVNRVFTHFDIAEMVNARRETVGEFLKQLRADGVIELRKRRIVIRDAAALESYLA